MTPALVRAEGYRLLAQALRYPDPAALAEDLRAAADAPAPVSALAGLAPFVDDELPGEHNRLFAQSVACSPYESSHVRADKGSLMGQLAALYAAFGVRVGGAEREHADHVGTELEFAALVALKEHLAENDEQREVCVAARRILLEEHLGRWVGPFTGRLAGVSPHPYYAALAAMLREWVAFDLREMGWAPAGTTEPEPPPVGDEVVCPMAPR